MTQLRQTKEKEVKITVIDYDENQSKEKEIANIKECFPFKETPTVTWINIDGIAPSIIETLGSHFELHPLILEDITTSQRPKIEESENYIFIIVKMLHEEDSELQIEQVSIILGPTFVISFQEGEGDIFDGIRERITHKKGRIRSRGADYLAYSLVDAIVDNYFVLLEHVGEKIEDLEEELVGDPSPKTLHRIHALKREILFLRKSVWPLREVISRLERIESSLIQESTEIYFRDVYEHTIQVIDTVETHRDMLSGMLDIYLSSVSNKMNEVMKVLTIFASIFIPLTFIAGIYGMNFQYMPELAWRWGYYVVLLGMGIVIAVMLVYFWRKDWL